jgi:GWxTD domain-containing protein
MLSPPVGMASAAHTKARAVLHVDTLDVVGADAYVRDVFRGLREHEYAHAAEVYLELVDLWGTSLDGQEQEIVQQQVAQALLVVPGDRRTEIANRAQPGAALVAWWMKQDPLPATARNERLIEHLLRVAYAEHHFRDTRSLLKFDERGEVFVRLGEPSQIRSIDYFRSSLIQRIHELRVAGGNSLIVSPSSFAASELWYYHGERPYHFFFVREGGKYSVGDVNDVIPHHLRSAIDGDTGRGGAKADVVLEVLRVVYQQLAPFDINYVERFHQVENYVGQLEDLAQEEALQVADLNVASAARRVDYSAVAQRRGAFFPGRNTPAAAADGFIEQARREDHYMRMQRDERLPASRSTVLDGVVPLSLATRLARFLNRDGSTRLEVYWAPEAAALPLDPSLREAAGQATLDRYPDQVIRAALVRDASRTGKRVGQMHYITLPARALASREPMAAQMVIADSLQAGEDLALQWDQMLARVEGADVELGARARIAVLRTENLEPLRGDGHLEMSDLKPVDAPAGEPYPFESVQPATPLALYFEAYGLTYGPRDEVDFRVDYEIRLLRREGLLRRLREATTAGNLISTIVGRRTEQFLILDTALWAGAEQADITITVLDRTSGRTVSRSITFDVAGR